MNSNILHSEDKWVKMVNKICLLKSNSDYRVGDIIFHKGWGPKRDQWRESQKNVLNKEEFNGTILKEYIIKTNYNKRIPIPRSKIGEFFHEIINKKIIEKNYLIPHKNELVIHLRVGDTISGKNFLIKPYIQLIQDSVNNDNITHVTFVTGFHYGNNTIRPGTTLFKYNDNKHNKNIVKLTKLFKSVVLEFPLLNIDVMSSTDIDRDLVYMCKANHFIRDHGGFSTLLSIIQQVIKKCDTID